MDKTIEVVLVAVVVIATAAIMLFIFTGESSNFSDFVSEQISGAEEDLDDHQSNGNNGGGDSPNCGQYTAEGDCNNQPECEWQDPNGPCTTS